MTRRVHIDNEVVVDMIDHFLEEFHRVGGSHCRGKQLGMFANKIHFLHTKDGPVGSTGEGIVEFKYRSLLAKIL
jgi:hypothetical protein